MTPPLLIESPQNPRVKDLVKLRERRTRERRRRFVIEGVRETERALDAGVKLLELYLCPALLSREGTALAARLGKPGDAVELVHLSVAAFKKASLREHPDGVLAVAPTPEQGLSGLEPPGDALVLVLDGLEKPGNLGALLRTADGAGVEAVIVTEGIGAGDIGTGDIGTGRGGDEKQRGSDLYNPNVIRASMGSLFSLPVLRAGATETLEWLRERGFAVIAASPHADTSYWQADYLGRVALVLGTEHAGLSPFWEAAAARRVAIPMYGRADSLNVATAGALIVYEALRQRSRSARAGS